MEKWEIDMHLAAGKAYGRENTCGRKIDYKSEESAVRAAEALSAKFDRELEAYPCAFCFGWHIGRTMTAEERTTFAAE